MHSVGAKLHVYLGRQPAASNADRVEADGCTLGLHSCATQDDGPSSSVLYKSSYCGRWLADGVHHQVGACPEYNWLDWLILRSARFSIAPVAVPTSSQHQRRGAEPTDKECAQF